MHFINTQVRLSLDRITDYNYNGPLELDVLSNWGISGMTALGGIKECVWTPTSGNTIEVNTYGSSTSV